MALAPGATTQLELLHAEADVRKQQPDSDSLYDPMPSVATGEKSEGGMQKALQGDDSEFDSDSTIGQGSPVSVIASDEKGLDIEIDENQPADVATSQTVAEVPVYADGSPPPLARAAASRTDGTVGGLHNEAIATVTSTDDAGTAGELALRSESTHNTMDECSDLTCPQCVQSPRCEYCRMEEVCLTSVSTGAFDFAFRPALI